VDKTLDGERWGERFWCEVLLRLPDGSRLVRVDNETIGDYTPRLDTLLALAFDEPVLDTTMLS
jgi:hypothetical protein